MYVFRGLEGGWPQIASAPVVVLEGRRAVGKTSMTTHLRDSCLYSSYSDLSELATRQRASVDPDAWVRSLERPAIIDEAQLVPEVSVAVKRLVDDLGLRGETGHQFLLTGSAVVGRGSLGGSDPLAGRSVRVPMFPLTQSEMIAGRANRQVGALIDDLFDGPLTNTTVSPVGQAELVRWLTYGGIPAYLFAEPPLTPTRLNGRVIADRLALTGDRLLPDERRFDGSRAAQVLDALVRTPGQILNKSRLANELNVDPRVLAQYIDVLERRFLISELPNLAGGAGAARKGHPKVHPVDTSLSMESLSRAGHDPSIETELLGQVLESWVVAQVIPATAWSTLGHVDPFYWRDAKQDREVDLVLRDDRGRLVGVEVKLSSAVSRSDANGLVALRTAKREFHRGYVVYNGSSLHRLVDDIWALPLSLIAAGGLRTDGTLPAARDVLSLGRAETAHRDGIDQRVPSPTFSLFLSYVHSDDDHLDGLLRAFARQVADEYRFQTGQPLELFTDHDIAWGEAWRTRITDELDRASFLLAMVTPSYIRSEACRDEVISFLAAPERDERFLAVRVLDPRADADDVADNPAVTSVIGHINEHQYLDGAGLADLQAGTPPFKRMARAVTEDLIAAVARLELRQAGDVGLADPHRRGPSDDEDATDVMTRIEELQSECLPAFQEAGDDLSAAIEAWGPVFAAGLGRLPAGSNPATMNKALIATAHQLTPHVRALDDAAQRVVGAWNAVDQHMRAITNTMTEPSMRALLGGLDVSLAQGADMLDTSHLLEIREQVQAMSKLSRALQPAATSLDRALGILDTIATGMRSWSNAISGPAS